jgi:hypothetical protein
MSPMSSRNVEIVGSPSSIAHHEPVGIAGRYCETLWDLASTGDVAARRQVVELHVAYLVWAYAGRGTS